MLAIRLSRIGKKNSAFFRVVVMDKQKSAKGRALEVLGSVNPHKKAIALKNERILYWIGVGAQPSDRVHNILVSKNVIKGPKRVKKIRKSKKAADETAAKLEVKEAATTGPETKDEKAETLNTPSSQELAQPAPVATGPETETKEELAKEKEAANEKTEPVKDKTEAEKEKSEKESKEKVKKEEPAKEKKLAQKKEKKEETK